MSYNRTELMDCYNIIDDDFRTVMDEPIFQEIKYYRDRMGDKKEKRMMDKFEGLSEVRGDESHSFDFASLRQTLGFPECFFDPASHSCPGVRG